MENTTIQTLSVWDHKDAGRLASQIAYHLLYPTPTNPDVSWPRVIRVDLAYREGDFSGKPACEGTSRRFVVVDIFEAINTKEYWRLYQSYNCFNPSATVMTRNTIVAPIMKGGHFENFIALVLTSLIGQVLASGRMEFCDQGHKGSTDRKLTFFIAGTGEKLSPGFWTPEERVPRFLAFQKERCLSTIETDGIRMNLGQRFCEDDLAKLFLIWHMDSTLLSTALADWATQKLSWLVDRIKERSPLCNHPGSGCSK